MTNTRRVELEISRWCEPPVIEYEIPEAPTGAVGLNVAFVKFHAVAT